MTQEELQKILKENKKLNINEVFRYIFDLKQETSISKHKNGITENEYYFYDGEVNAYCVCLDLLKKLSLK